MSGTGSTVKTRRSYGPYLSLEECVSVQCAQPLGWYVVGVLAGAAGPEAACSPGVHDGRPTS